MATKQEIDEIVEYITKSLGAFAVLAIVWVALDSLAAVTNAGLLGFFAGIAFLAALGAMIAVIVLAGYLLTK